MPDCSLSVIIPTHDESRWTLYCVRSVLASTGAHPIDIIVVADRSRNDILEELDSGLDKLRKGPEFPPGSDLRLIRNERPGRFSAAANAGAAVARGDILLFLNNDALLDLDSLEHLRACFRREDAPGIVGAALFYPAKRRTMDLDPGAVPVREPQWSGGCTPDSAWLFRMASGITSLLRELSSAYDRHRPLHPPDREERDWVAGTALAIRRDVWDRIGPFREAYAFYCQDIDLCLAAGRIGEVSVIDSNVQVTHFHGMTSTGRAGAARSAGEKPEEKWCDLYLWARRRWTENPGRAERARFAMVLGGFLRIALRRLVTDFQEDQCTYRHDTNAYRHAVEALLDPELPYWIRAKLEH